MWATEVNAVPREYIAVLVTNRVLILTILVKNRVWSLVLMRVYFYEEATFLSLSIRPSTPTMLMAI